MKKMLLPIIVLLSCVTSVWSLSTEDFPNEFLIKNTKEYQGSVHLTANGQTIGTLMMAPYKSGTYDFNDAENQQKVTLKLTKIHTLATGLSFDVYDYNQLLIAKLFITRNHKSGQLMRFMISTPDEKTVLVTGSSNLFGTVHTIYAENSWHKLAVLNRPLFTLSRDSEVLISDTAGIYSRVDPNVFAAVLAVYSSERGLAIDPNEEPKVPTQLQALHTRLQKLAQSRGLSSTVKVSDEQLKIAADTLNQHYQQMYDDSQLSEEEKIHQFVEFGCGLIESNAYTPSEELAMWKFIISRLPM